MFLKSNGLSTETYLENFTTLIGNMKILWDEKNSELAEIIFNNTTIKLDDD